jgi:hypothetical protein
VLQAPTLVNEDVGGPLSGAGEQLTDEQRIWFAMGVITSGKVPGRPGGNDAEGNALVPEAQAEEAQEWLDKNKKQ